jgi:glycosyltransferase involved in cell wall biosynthesis
VPRQGSAVSMKIIIARSAAAGHKGLDGYATALCDFLASEGHQTQSLDLPSIAAPGRALANVASFRLLGTAASADALICLDPVAAVLRHPRKLVWLHDDAYLDADPAQLPEERTFACGYLAKVLRSSLKEAAAIFSPSRFALEKLSALSFDRAELLQPALPASHLHYKRNPGPELLVLNALDDRQRPELLISCLAALPEPYRARWIASSAQPGSLARIRRLAEDAKVEQRLVIEMRAIDAGENAYLMAHAAALLEPAANAFAIPDTVHDAVRTGVPVIACNDGGALTEIYPGRASPRPAEPAGAALAKAMLAIRKSPDKELSGSVPFAKTSATSWAPLLKALSE